MDGGFLKGFHGWSSFHGEDSKSSATLEVPGGHSRLLVVPSFTSGDAEAWKQLDGDREPQKESGTWFLSRSLSLLGTQPFDL